MNKKVLVIDDDADLCLLISHFLAKKGYELVTMYSGRSGLQAFKETTFDAVICDYRLGDTEASELVGKFREIRPSATILVVTGYSDLRTAIRMIKLGADDYLAKPLVPDDVLAALEKKREVGAHANAIAEIPTLRRSKEQEPYYKGNDPLTRSLYEQTELVAKTDYSVILYGESGTGKEVIARSIHDSSHRANKPFVALDCGTLSRELAVSELFGHIKGSFTGAITDKIGHFEMAAGGTLFLDEIGNLGIEVQTTLLRVLQEKKFKRLGGTKELQADVRIIVASNENLRSLYEQGRFREDLYHRFNEFSIILPPLRQRREDIIPLANFFLEQVSRETGKELLGFDDEVKQLFLEYPWPGNLRELRNAIRVAALRSHTTLINADTLPPELRAGTQEGPERPGRILAIEHSAGKVGALKTATRLLEYDRILGALKQVHFNKKKAAELLQIDRKTLYTKIKKLDIQLQS